jgi:hypothetical protein
MRVVELLAAGELDPQIGLRTSWTEVSEAAQPLLDRRGCRQGGIGRGLNHR